MVKVAIWETGEIFEFDDDPKEFAEKIKKIIEETEEDEEDNDERT
jgi:hypothetical protein